MAGPLFGSGYMPAASPLGNELATIIRRAYIPKIVVQDLYNVHPMLSLLLRNAQRASGGVSPITVPVQGASFVTAQWAGYDGGFAQPTVNTALQPATFNLSVAVVPIPFYGMEALVSSSEVIVPRTLALMSDAGSILRQLLANTLYVANTNPLAMVGLLDAYDDSTTVATYGGINRTTAGNAFWKGTVKTSAGAVLTRAKWFPYLMSMVNANAGEEADMIVMSLSDWTTLATDYMTSESFRTVPGTRYGKDDPINAGFSALMLANTPIFADPYLAAGTAYFLNSKYLALYLHEDAPFTFSGFYPLIANNQIAQQGVLIAALATVCTKPKSGMRVTGITGGATL